MKNYHLGILFIFFTAVLPAQDKDLEKEIMQYSESKSDLISKGRRLLTDKFLEGDLAKVKEVKDYLLKEVEDDYYIALYPGEIFMIRYWTGEYEQLVSSIIDLDQEELARYSRKISPPRDMMYVKLIERSWENLEMLENNILDSSLDTQQKDFLLLYLNYMVSGEPLMKMDQEEVNEMANLFMETYPESPYEEYLRNNIRYQYVPNDWGLGVEFFTGYGLLTGDLSGQYSNTVIVGFDFDLEYKKFTLYLRGYIGIGKLKRDREFSTGIWEKGATSNIGIPEASFGYAVLDNKTVKLSPFAGIGGIEITAPQPDIDKYPELEDASLYSTVYTLGINLDVKLGWDTSAHLMYNVPKDKSYWFLRVRYGYTLPQLNEVGHNGNIHHITIGIGGVYRGMKRVF